MRRFSLVSWLRATDPYQSCIGLSTAQKSIAPEKSEVGQKGEKMEEAADTWIQDERRSPHWSRWRVPEGATACGEPMLKHFCFPEGLHPTEEAHARAGGIVSCRSCGEELFWTHHSCPWCPGWEVWESRVKEHSAADERGKQRCHLICLFSSLPESN